MGHRGLDPQGFIAREGSLGRVPAPFREVVAAARTRIAEAYGPRLHSAYLYGSVPRGTARPGRSGLDMLVALHREPTGEDRDTAEVLVRGLDLDFARAGGVIRGAGILLHGKETLLGEAQRYELGWFLACLCTPLLGADLAEHLPRYRPDTRLARETGGDLEDVLATARERAAAARTDAELRELNRFLARRLVRTGFTLVMPRWGGWTSDLAESAEIFARYHPERADQMRAAAAEGLDPGTDRGVLRTHLEDLGPWLTAEHTARHGRRGPRRAGEVF
ncbi:nucleotidyltransferase domain-containing protein [Streptomyces sp. NPDC006529]|uniref:nucleotidyltransferase domain-containing protein n=1 Tax=Streptomyces sp. NPDC006529 TaxID=3157177 RepID=UPI0033A1F8B7